MVSSLYIASLNSIISKLWNLRGINSEFLSSHYFPHIESAQRHELKMLQDKEHKCGTSSAQGTHIVLCPCRQETSPANHPASLHMSLHPADTLLLVKSPLQNTILCSEKIKIKNLKLHHQKGRITRLPSWNECVSAQLFTCKTTIQNAVIYKLWPKSLFMFFFSKCHLR